LLLIDTNILVRCSAGNAMPRIFALRDRGVALATTENNANEMFETLLKKFGHNIESADREVRRILEPLELIGLDEYANLRGDAGARLRDGGKSDWPALAAAMALDGEIWSEDVDFFGVGVPVWSTANVHLVTAETE
jgi:predicted nucleic acid-binding protein